MFQGKGRSKKRRCRENVVSIAPPKRIDFFAPGGSERDRLQERPGYSSSRRPRPGTGGREKLKVSTDSKGTLGKKTSPPIRKKNAQKGYPKKGQTVPPVLKDHWFQDDQQKGQTTEEGLRRKGTYLGGGGGGGWLWSRPGEGSSRRYREGDGSRHRREKGTFH